jgi:restriction endonuclease
MAKRPTAESRSSLESSRHVADVFRQLGWDIESESRSRDDGADFHAVRADGFLYQRIAVEVKTSNRPVSVSAVRSLAGIVAASGKMTNGILIAKRFTREAQSAAANLPNLNLVTFERLEEQVFRETGSRSRARTRAGRAILANQPEIAVTSAAIIVLIDERLAQLRNERPNSSEATSDKESSIEQYERLKQDVTALADAAAKFRQGAVSEREAVKASKSMFDGIRGWWDKGHEKICERTFDMGLFATAVSICSMAGAGGKVTVAVSAALVGGKQLGTALKGLKGLWN